MVKYAEEWGTKAPVQQSGKAPGGQSPVTEVITPGELMRRLGRKVEGVNLLEVERYLRDSKVICVRYDLRVHMTDICIFQ